jgi:hypothetical protein
MAVATQTDLVFITILIVSWIGIVAITMSRWIHRIIKKLDKMNKKIDEIMKHLKIE